MFLTKCHVVIVKNDVNSNLSSKVGQCFIRQYISLPEIPQKVNQWKLYNHFPGSVSLIVTVSMCVGSRTGNFPSSHAGHSDDDLLI